ncbi:MAG TPA: DUF5719 family protein [Candidatus Lumbricidophila sp.]|nr:DUF5719 family protein [Candidatus Lumbricidophila sp.]
MASARGFAIASGRSLAALIAGAAAAVAVTAASVVPWPSYSAVPPKLSVQPSDSRQLRACPGAFLDLGATAAASQVSSVGVARVTSGTGDGGSVTTGSLKSPDTSAAGSTGGDSTAASPQKLEVAPGSVAPGMLAGAQSQTIATETLAGLASTTCAEPLADSWLVGGTTGVGRTSLVILTNPSNAPATVDLTVTDEHGAVASNVGKRVNVPANSQRVLSLAGIAPDLLEPVVHVQSRGAKVAAFLMQSAINGLVPAGADLVPAIAAGFTSLTIPGFVVPQALAAPVGDEDNSDATAAVRVFAPQGVDAAGTIRLVPEGGGTPIDLKFTLPAGNVTDVPLGAIAAGNYAVFITANTPVVAAARTVQLTNTAMTDFAWAVASPAVHGALAVAIPDAPSPVLWFANPDAAPIKVAVNVGGAITEVTVPAQGAAQLAVSANSVLTIQDGGGAHMAVSMGGTSGTAVIPVVPPGPSEAAVTVYPR